jgi:hypothetical protein
MSNGPEVTSGSPFDSTVSVQAKWVPFLSWRNDSRLLMSPLSPNFIILEKKSFPLASNPIHHSIILSPRPFSPRRCETKGKPVICPGFTRIYLTRNLWSDQSIANPQSKLFFRSNKQRDALLFRFDFWTKKSTFVIWHPPRSIICMLLGLKFIFHEDLQFEITFRLALKLKSTGSTSSPFEGPHPQIHKLMRMSRRGIFRRNLILVFF